MSEANETQVGGDHYRTPIQHWDYVWANRLDYFQAQITKYVTRWKKKNGLQDLQKARHFLDKYIELVEPNLAEEGHAGYVNQDPDLKGYSPRPGLRRDNPPKEE